MQKQTGDSNGDIVPLYAPCRKLSIGDPFRWLKMGWQDFKRTPWHSLAYGLAFVFFGWLFLYVALANDNNALIVSLIFGFLIMGPVLCFGLYDISHQLEQNHKPTFRHERQKAFHEMGHERLFATMMSMLLVLLFMVLSIMAGIEPEFGQTTGSYVVASLLIAMVFAGLAFCTSVFTLPMILHQDTDGATAILTSINAVLRNTRVLALWALIIFVLTAVGFATLIGLALIAPVLGYATWHGYRETIITKG
ncbi:MAG: DUF2189 domain-containing protein [gamma proteobacterium symbiont of Clathrolucina costata]|uniref:DUF2189 domain-containing protein n=1 Tax=Candidatus Thiodiazotropha taylori TaxID=2792791 RepID=A0A9E4NI85_9GAMM|nr:DUF2189 domain-containing protein [Candidatus Thiodiazotropha sp. (ex Lucina pensylvanica)]MBT3015521.1 DUF2189 domain-containing protein [Candidatus Thiodiazotropha taylori]MBT3040301.1 DUF2189 domain-containing protein [Candidatus Thiodiazotropha sp. (ex Codakia orbicularis)]MCG7864130.1 DUF2189 domain-containing protein [Candidatus Thiodiazotropha endolucinida]MBT3031361.1 DUF2189 domain-containing protein [Candidatus Thiodiazotropha sp. (ex Lucina pensylvanica)]